MMHCDGPDKEIYCRGIGMFRLIIRSYFPGPVQNITSNCKMACTCRLVSMFLACFLTDPQCSLYVQAWHRECFKCGECMKRLDSTNCCEGPDKDIYCKGSFFSFRNHFQLRYCCYLTFILQFSIILY